MTRQVHPAEVSAATARLLGGDRRAGTTGPGPDAERLIPAPPDYAGTWTDVARARALSILADPDLHFTLYGRAQGRAVLPAMGPGVSRVVMISPSHGKRCGIGEYGCYLGQELAALGLEVTVVRSAEAALALGRDALCGTLVLVNHGPGLFDGLNPRLSQGGSTTGLLQALDRMRHGFGALPVVLQHSLLDADHDLLFSRQAQILDADIPKVTFVTAAGRHFFLPALELGISPVPLPDPPPDQRPDQRSDQRPPAGREDREEVIGFFGFFQYGGKDFDSLFHLARELRARLVGSIATSDAEDAARFEEVLEDLSLPHDFTTGWVKDTDLLSRLAEADYFYLPQNDYDHWNNSATARFVANLDRPLFLPPHQPFLDMTDGAILATREDLPRIAAHIREETQYARAVARVRAFRDRAAMRHTAKALCTGLVPRLSEMGSALLETPSACSAERFLELPWADQGRFARTLGADPDRPDSFPAPFRAPEQPQFWRKHYEAGDLIHPTLLETVHAIHRAVTRQAPPGAALLRLCEGGQGFGTVVQAALRQALEMRGTPFHEPQVVLLENGRATDWEKATTPAEIETFLTRKTDRRARIAAALEGPGPLPPVSNVTELLLLPPEALRRRPAPVDLSALDWEHIQTPRRLGSRLNRLVAAANAEGIDLARHFVFDRLLPPAIAPRERSYVAEDFLYLDGTAFLQGAIRRIDKRDPEVLEVLVLGALAQAQGKRAVLDHLLQRAEGRIAVDGLDRPEVPDVAQVLEVLRDPLFGLIEARNAYEVARRHAARWQARIAATIATGYPEAQAAPGRLALAYLALCETPARRADPGARRQDPIWRIDAQGRFLPRLPAPDDWPALVPGVTLRPGQAARFGFHPPETPGMWTDGPEGTLLLRLDRGLPRGGRLAVDLGLLAVPGAERRRIFLSLRRTRGAPLPRLDTATPPLATREATVTGDGTLTLSLDLAPGTEPGALTLRLLTDRADSPEALGTAPDPRRLGLLLRGVTLTDFAVE